MRGLEILLTFLTIVAVSCYDLGSIHKYSYVTTTSIDEKCVGRNESQLVGLRLATKLQLTAIWQDPQDPTHQLIKIEVLEPQLWTPKQSSFVAHSSNLDKITWRPSFILREKGSVLKIWDDPNENYAIRNIKRGIANLLHIQKKDQVVREAGVAGNCEVIYEVQSKHMKKRKANCIHFQFDRSLTQPHGVRSASIPHWLSSECNLLDEKSDTISSCTVTEYAKTFSNLWQKPSLCVSAISELSFESVTKGNEIYENQDAESVITELKKSNAGNLEKGDLEAILISKESSKQSNLADYVKKYQDSLKTANLAKIKSALSFYKLLPFFRSASKEDITKVLTNKNFKPIQGQILDLIAASSTEKSMQATLEHFKDVKNYDEMLERFLISLSVTPRPKDYVMREIKSFLDGKTHNEKIHSTLCSSLGAVLKTYGQHHDIANYQILEDYRTYLENKLNECTTERCVIAFLRSLRNAAFPSSAPLLLKYASKGGKSALEAVLAVRNIDVASIPLEIQRNLLNIFLQIGSKQDRSTRSVAADILLDLNPDNETLKGILSSLSDQTDSEFSTFLTSKVMQKASLDKDLRLKLLKLLPEKYISYYYSFSQKGTSSLFTRPLLISNDMSVNYGIQMEMLAGGLLKRSVFDVNFETPVVSNLLSVGMFGEGMSSFAGDSSGEDGVDPQAGMELTLLGSSLRPYIFFTGTSELMSHAWSGTASEPTPALQGIFSFSDDERMIVLNNGMIVQMQLRGVLSTDLSASVQISLWNRNSQSQVKNAGALLMRGAVTIDTGFSSLQGAFQYSGQSAIDFSTDLDFAQSPFQMCLTMEHPAITVKYDTHRSVSVPGTKYSLRRTKKRRREIPSKSYALHGRNNEQCRQLK